jgi:hypothetical protein
MKIYCFDLDGTLCTNTNGEYKNATPFLDRIKKLNDLHKNGNKIIIDTARGSTTGIDWYDLTENQLRSWGVNFDELIVGRKVHADFFIDDKGINDNIFFNE